MKKTVKFVVWTSFFVYLAVVAGLVFFSRYRVGFFEDISIWEYARYQMNLVPFKTILEYIKAYYDGSMSKIVPLRNLIGNLIMFFPWGIYLPLLFDKMKHWKKYIIVTIATLFGIELVQFFGRLGSFDIDDLILNLIGAMLGFCVWKTKLFRWLERMI
ncbi:MAG: VanZ family protein [Lachnospiraceae bacterium]|nr:VanZ family protein [Lachnospiraceae bacterium]